MTSQMYDQMSQTFPFPESTQAPPSPAASAKTILYSEDDDHAASVGMTFAPLKPVEEECTGADMETDTEANLTSIDWFERCHEVLQTEKRRQDTHTHAKELGYIHPAETFRHSEQFVVFMNKFTRQVTKHQRKKRCSRAGCKSAAKYGWGHAEVPTHCKKHRDASMVRQGDTSPLVSTPSTATKYQLNNYMAITKKVFPEYHHQQQAAHANKSADDQPVMTDSISRIVYNLYKPQLNAWCKAYGVSPTRAREMGPQAYSTFLRSSETMHALETELPEVCAALQVCRACEGTEEERKTEWKATLEAYVTAHPPSMPSTTPAHTPLDVTAAPAAASVAAASAAAAASTAAASAAAASTATTPTPTSPASPAPPAPTKSFQMDMEDLPQQGEGDSGSGSDSDSDSDLSEVSADDEATQMLCNDIEQNLDNNMAFSAE